MEKNYEKLEVREVMYKELNKLMEEASCVIREGKDHQFYNLETHYYLMKNAYEIMFPFKRESWPNKFHDFLADSNLPWPQGSTYSYIMSVICPPFVSPYSLFFGYAVVSGELVRTTFFAINTIVEYQLMPQSMVIDPLCLDHEIKPDYYVGCWAEKEDIDNFMILRRNPLEMFVERKNKQEHKERLYNTYMESYNLQMTCEPGYFPPQLIKFCQENDLYIPPQEKGVDDL